MRKVISGSRPHGLQDKQKKKTAQEAWVIWRKKREGKCGREEKNRQKEARHVAREGAQSNPLAFIHTVSINYQCIY